MRLPRGIALVVATSCILAFTPAVLASYILSGGDLLEFIAFLTSIEAASAILGILGWFLVSYLTDLMLKISGRSLELERVAEILSESLKIALYFWLLSILIATLTIGIYFALSALGLFQLAEFFAILGMVNSIASVLIGLLGSGVFQISVISRESHVELRKAILAIAFPYLLILSLAIILGYFLLDLRLPVEILVTRSSRI